MAETTPLPALPRIAFGGGTLGRENDEAASRELLDYALERGLTLIDTAESYGGGNARQSRREIYRTEDVREATGEMHSSEKIIGRWMRERKNRDRLILCTKLSTGGTRARVHQALRESLDRLQTGHADIYLLHKPLADAPIRETLEALTEEIAAGRIRAVGCSNFSLAQLREALETAEAHGLARMRYIQPPFNLVDPAARNELFPYCRAQGVSVVTYSPLAAGFLTGKYAPGAPIPKGTRFDVVPANVGAYCSEERFALVEKLRALAAETGESMTRLALAWVFQCPDVASVLIGARGRPHIDNAVDALACRLPPGVKARMDAWL